ncbi:alpha/beta hydrolase fold domain-containing protein [Acetobacteraceae bacterium H6797]|nr:alpha/beta hydrolase fold domain-containing protein [Acetobacteraceae bacterium H6797]
MPPLSPQDVTWDPEMLAFTRRMDQVAKGMPPIVMEKPFDKARALNEALNLPLSQGGPVMAESRDVWVLVRGRRMQCRLHIPQGAQGPVPVLIYVHGGGWVWASIDTHDRLMREYAAASGFAVLGPDYALSPEAVFPQAIEETAGIVRWVKEEGASLGFDTERVILGGDSAGANLALGATLLLQETDPALRLSGLLLNYGVFDADLETPSYRDYETGFGLTRERMSFYWEAYCPRPADRLNPIASPLRASTEALSRLPPTLLHIAQLDVLASENHAMAARFEAAGVALTKELFPGTTHGFLRAQEEVGAARRSATQAGAWMKGLFA